MTPDGAVAAVVIFSGAAQDGRMSDKAFELDVASWLWTALDIGDGPMPCSRAGACLCPFDANAVFLFGGATPGDDDGLVGLNDAWALRVDAARGQGTLTCLLAHSDDALSSRAPRQPGRNAATLDQIDANAFLSPSIAREGAGCAHFLLQASAARASSGRRSFAFVVSCALRCAVRSVLCLSQGKWSPFSENVRPRVRPSRGAGRLNVRGNLKLPAGEGAPGVVGVGNENVAMLPLQFLAVADGVSRNKR